MEFIALGIGVLIVAGLLIFCEEKLEQAANVEEHAQQIVLLAQQGRSTRRLLDFIGSRYGTYHLEQVMLRATQINPLLGMKLYQEQQKVNYRLKQL